MGWLGDEAYTGWWLLPEKSEEMESENVAFIMMFHWKKWRLIIQLDAERYYFLSVFIGEDGRLDKFSLDEEGAADSHYEFKEEREIRKKLYVAGDEDKYLDEILIRYAAQYGPQCLKGLILPYVTAQFHYD